MIYALQRAILTTYPIKLVVNRQVLKKATEVTHHGQLSNQNPTENCFPTNYHSSFIVCWWFGSHRPDVKPEAPWCGVALVYWLCQQSIDLASLQDFGEIFFDWNQCVGTSWNLSCTFYADSFSFKNELNSFFLQVKLLLEPGCQGVWGGWCQGLGSVQGHPSGKVVRVFQIRSVWREGASTCV